MGRKDPSLKVEFRMVAKTWNAESVYFIEKSKAMSDCGQLHVPGIVVHF